ncbi:hypothetical protein H6P81_020213 [Aristolochia fimbriata]|uniref:Uncharacterized protein n=1 Tax=Aristolochia fimbriata TaxID=158543 RepID=A0AAV7DTY0_ARIFI|nr:hypothetical protein H6P81_020213 [Aristolochia fimbriata]
MENMKDSHREELLAMEARMQEQLQTKLQEYMQRFIAMMKTLLSAFDSSFSQRVDSPTDKTSILCPLTPQTLGSGCP